MFPNYFIDKLVQPQALSNFQLERWPLALRMRFVMGDNGDALGLIIDYWSG